MKKDTKQQIQDTLQHIISLFQAGNVPQAIKIATFPPFEKPSNHWSLANKIIMLQHNTLDARTYNQWAKEERSIKKGEKAFRIFGPRKSKIKEENENGEETEKYILKGFLLIPVFRLEQTEGKPINYEPIALPNLPLMEKAEEWNIDVSAVDFSSKCYGYYSHGKSEKIRLASPHEIIFFHELSHAAHKRVMGKLKPGQDCEQEIVAELSAQVLAQMIGTQIESTIGNSFSYIQSYSRRMGKDVGFACLSVLSQVEKVLNLILERKEDEVEKNID